MDAQVFWNVIGNYNEQTKIAQICLFIIIILAIAFSYMQKVKWAAKFVLGITNLFIGIVFFGLYGTEPIQKYFAKSFAVTLSTLSVGLNYAWQSFSTNGNVYYAVPHRQFKYSCICRLQKEKQITSCIIIHLGIDWNKSSIF